MKKARTPKGAALYTYKTIPHEWRNCGDWQRVSVDHMEDDERARFDRLAKAIRTYLSNGALRQAAKDGECSKQTVLEKLNRCLTLTDDGAIVGWRGLLSHVRLSSEKYKRGELPAGAGAGERGASGSFELFLCEHEAIREKLHAAIRSGGSATKAKLRNPKQRSVYQRFRDACEELTDEDYPFNSRSKGRRSVERYAVAYIAQDPEAIETWYGRDARDGLAVGTGLKGFPLAVAPLDFAGADAHELHCHGVVVIPGPSGPQRVPIERIWIFPVLDRVSKCAYRYSVSIRTEVNAAAIEEALEACSIPWTPRDLTVQGQRYAPGAGFPIGTIEGLTECRPAVLQVDNAAAHYAKRIVHAARRSLGCAVTWGPCGAWWRNGFTERFFRTLEMYGFQCLPSSSGSNAQDVHRDKPIPNAIRNEITWEELIDLVDVLIANYNATAHDSLGGRSPLEAMRTGLDARHATFLPRMPVPVTAHTPALGTSVEVRRIAGQLKKGSAVRPYVQVDEARYTAPALSSRLQLIGQPIIVHIRERDMQISGFLENGEALGILTCLDAGWAIHPHSRDMRKTINALIRNGDIPGDDPVAEYMVFLAKKTAAEARRSPNKVSHSGTQLAEASRITGLRVPAAPTRAAFAQVPARPVPGHIPRPDWRRI